MSNPIGVFISYRNTMTGRLVAEQLYQNFDSRGFKPYWDKKFIEAGDRWDEEIFASIHSSEVLIVLLEDKVIESDWIQREVDIARSAQIQILPLLLESMKPEPILQKLGIDKHQFEKYDIGFDYEKLCGRVTNLAQKTRKEQQRQMQLLQERWKKSPAATSLNYARYKLRDSDYPVRIHLATGSIEEFRNIDVLVNSENDYLQMSRIHENYTVSSILRYAGSLKKPGSGRLMEDTVQWELDAQADAMEEGRPFVFGTVLPTNAGHPTSVLRQKNKIRYIFHVVTVMVFAKGHRQPMVPVDTDDGIRECVMNTLDCVERVNANKGVISPIQLSMSDGRQPRQEELDATGNYTPITSILLPMFGTGHAGRAISEVIKPMTQAVRDWLVNAPETTLKTVYLCAYADDDIESIKSMMDRVFEPLPK